MPEFDSTIEYRDIPGFCGYAAGSDGTIWSRKRNPQWKRRILVRYGDYQGITIGPKSYYVHRLVLLAFVGPCPPGMECCHDPDHDHDNNSIKNLRWDTPNENQQDKFRQGRMQKSVLNKAKKIAGIAARKKARDEKREARKLLPSHQVLYQRKMVAEGRCAQCGKQRERYARHCNECWVKMYKLQRARLMKLKDLAISAKTVRLLSVESEMRKADSLP